MKINIAAEEAIYYLESALKESIVLFQCARGDAPLMRDWAHKVQNILCVIFGPESNENHRFCSQKFEGNQDEVVKIISFSTGLLRDCVRSLKRLMSVNAFSRDCFVAMWFDDSMEEIYHCGIYKPLKELGYNPIRVDKVEHNDRIDSKIFDLIRRSRFVVADFSGHRTGVYYESGFASGLGLPVIHTCRKDDFEKRHFDVHTINTIVYENVEELAVGLRKRIIETVK